MIKIINKYQKIKVLKILFIFAVVMFLTSWVVVEKGKRELSDVSVSNRSLRMDESLRVNLGKFNADNLITKVKDAYGREIVVSAQTTESNGETQLDVAPPSGIKPGKYVLELSDAQEKISHKSIEFRWGVLAVNTDQAIYEPGSDIELYLASLDDEGHTLCSSNLELEIISPSGDKKIFNTDNPEGEEIIRGEECGDDNVTDLPDYKVDYYAEDMGEYQLKLINLDTNFSISDSFEVSGDLPFVIKRKGATRINPFKASYGMNITVTSKINFDGEFIEEVPKDFLIMDSDIGFLRRKKEDRVQLVWPLKIAAGETKVFSYYYRTPLVSPWLYTIGPSFVARRDSEVIFSESRKWKLASDASGEGIASLGGTQTTDSININDFTAFPILWSTVGYDTEFFSHSAVTNPERLTVLQAGDYLVSATLPMNSAAARSTVRMEVRVNGVAVNGAIGESSYVRNSSGQTESSDHVSLLLTGLSINDYIEVYTEATAGNGTVTIDGQASLLVENVDAASRTAFSATATQTTNSTNLNQATAFPMQWTEGRKDAGITHSNATSSENITLDDAGDYLVFANIPLESTSGRSNVKLLVELDGIVVPGGEGKQGFIRAAGGHNNSSIHWSGVVRSSSPGQVLTISTLQEGNNGTVSVTTGKTASLYLEKLPATDVYFARGNTMVGGNNWNPSIADEITWTTDEIIDTTTFTHSTVSNPQSITVNKDGDYLLTYNDSLTSAVVRANTTVLVRINGTLLSGAKTKSHYIRNSGGQNESSGTLAVLLEDLVAGDVVSVATEQEAATGQVDDNQDALLMLWYKPPPSRPLLAQMHYHWRNDDSTENNATSATGGIEDSVLSNIAKDSNIRLRLEVSNEGGAISAGESYRLEFGEKVTACSDVTIWTDVDSASDEWDMFDSANLTDGDNTTNIAISTGGVTDESVTFKTPNAGVKDTSSQVASMLLDQNEFAELEFSLKATTLATSAASYCFRVTNAGTELDVYSTYPEISIAPDVIVYDSDFKIQRGEGMVSGVGMTLTAGVDYDQPLSASRAFIRITNTQLTGAGDDNSGGNQNADDVTAYVANPGNIMSSVDIVRMSSISNSHVSWEIIEYIGPGGGANEMVVRDQGTTTYLPNDLTVSTAGVAGILDDNDVVPFITGYGNPDTGRNDYNTGLSTASWDAANDWINFTRGEDGSDAVITSWAAVEFVGINWKIQRAEHTYTTDGIVETEAITTVNDLAKTFIHTQKRAGAGLAGVDEFGHEIWVSSINQISFQLEGGSGTPANHTSVAWVMENTQTDGIPLDVTRSNGTQTGGAEPSSVLVNIGKPLTNLTVASIFTNSRSSGSGASFPRSIMGVMIANATQYRLWISDTGETNTYRTEVVEWPTAVHPSFTQAAYRWFSPDDSTDVGAPLEAQDTKALLSQAGEKIRLRMLISVLNQELALSGRSFRLQYSLSNGVCDSSFSGETYQDVTTVTDIAYFDNTTPADADTVTTNVNDPDLGNTIFPQEYVELNNFSNSISLITVGNDGLWDFSLTDNGANPGAYCFRVVDSDGNVFSTYNVVPELEVVFGSDILMRHGGFFDATGVRKPFTF